MSTQADRGTVPADRIYIGEAAQIAGVNRDSIDRAIRDGRLQVRRVGDRRTVSLQQLLEFKRNLWRAAR